MVIPLENTQVSYFLFETQENKTSQREEENAPLSRWCRWALVQYSAQIREYDVTSVAAARLSMECDFVSGWKRSRQECCGRVLLNRPYGVLSGMLTSKVRRCSPLLRGMERKCPFRTKKEMRTTPYHSSRSCGTSACLPKRNNQRNTRNHTREVLPVWADSQWTLTRLPRRSEAFHLQGAIWRTDAIWSWSDARSTGSDESERKDDEEEERMSCLPNSNTNEKRREKSSRHTRTPWTKTTNSSRATNKEKRLQRRERQTESRLRLRSRLVSSLSRSGVRCRTEERSQRPNHQQLSNRSCNRMQGTASTNWNKG